MLAYLLRFGGTLVHKSMGGDYRNALDMVRFFKRLTQFDTTGMHAAGRISFGFD
jgi:hypothetical protein